MQCPGSIAVAETMSARGELFEREDPDYTREGLCAHELAAHCLKTETDAWEHIGKTFYKEETATAEMATHVQVYLDTVRSLNYSKQHLHVEQRVGDEETGGTIDALGFDIERNVLDIIDLKYGEGIAVEAEWNTQLLTYAWEAFDFLQFRPSAPEFMVRLTIIQPRAFHPSGKGVRTFVVQYGGLEAWFEGECKPARERVDAGDAKLMPGEWCRFCPAKLGCPITTGMFGFAASADVKDVQHLNEERLGVEMQQIAVVKMYIKALEEETFRRLNVGGKVAGWKLVNKRANRAWKPEAVKAAEATFGQEAYEPAALKSPAQIDETCMGGKKFTAEWAFTPNTGLTVAPDKSTLPAVVQKPLAERFKIVVQAQSIDDL